MKKKYQINKSYILKKRDKLLQKQGKRYIQFKEFLRNNVELQKRLKSLGGNFLKE